MSEKPSRGAAIFLTLFGAGVGHAYVGLPKRAIAWFAGVLVVELSLAGLLLPVGKSIGFGPAFILFLVALLAAWLAPMIDLARLAPSRFHAVPRWVPFVFWIVTAVIIGGGARFFIRADLVEAFKIPSGGMMPTLLLGDHLFCDKHAYASTPPDRGEAMVFAFPENPGQDFVQRAIAIAGDKLEVRSGHPWINDWEVPHCALGNAQLGEGDDPRSGPVEVEFLDGHAYLTFYDAAAMSPDLLGPFTVQDGDTWTLGDNRFNSHDSPRWREGLGQGVPRDLVKGRAAFVWLRSSDAGIDTSRFGTSLSEPALPASMRDLAPALVRCMQSAPPYEKTVPPKR